MSNDQQKTEIHSEDENTMNNETFQPDVDQDPPQDEGSVSESEVQNDEEVTDESVQENDQDSDNSEELDAAAKSKLSQDIQAMLDKFEARMNKATDKEISEEKERGETTIERLQRELKEKDDLLKRYIQSHKAAVAEFDEARQRLSRDTENRVRAMVKNVLEDLLDVIDNLDRALESCRKENDVDTLLKGVEIVHEQFLASLKKQGVEKMSANGTAFNPEWHEAVAMVPVEDDEQDGMVVGIIKDGYRFNGEVLRPATVAVGKK